MSLTPLVSAPSASPSAGRVRAVDVAPDQSGQHPTDLTEGTPAEQFSALVRQHLASGSPAGDPGEPETAAGDALTVVAGSVAGLLLAAGEAVEAAEATPLPADGVLTATPGGMAGMAGLLPGLPVVGPQAAPAPTGSAGVVRPVAPAAAPGAGLGAPGGGTLGIGPAVTTGAEPGPALAPSGQATLAGPEASGPISGRASAGAAGPADDPATVPHASGTAPAGDGLLATLSTAGTSPTLGTSPTDGAAHRGGAGDVHQVTGQVFPEVTRLVSRGDGTHRLTLRLHPADLGEVKVILTVKDGVVDVALSAGAAAREALREGSPQLRSLLETVGVTPGQLVIREAGSQSSAPSGLPSTGSSGSSQSQQPPGTGQPPGQGDTGGNLAHRGPGGGADTGQGPGSGTGSPAGQRADHSTDHRAGPPSGAAPDRATRRLDLDL